MAKENHPRGFKVNDFCALAPCGCEKKNDYIGNCKPVAWEGVTFLQKGKKGPYEKKYEAHHILCVAPVTKCLQIKKLETVIPQTNWCINAKPNMIAMPVWGHTVKWYTTNGDSIRPAFADLPLHNRNHNGTFGYIEEIESALISLAADVDEQKCEVAASQLAKDLDDLSEEWRGNITTRGQRTGGSGKGTHDGWLAGIRGEKEWYIPFSMAKTGNVTPRTFPRNFGEVFKAMQEKLQKAMGGKS